MKLFAQIYGSGHPLLILHGLFGSGDNWATLAKRYATHFEVHCIDLRNHGRSPHHSDTSYPAMASDLLQYINSLSLNTACLLGHSMGGKTAMFFATENPDRVNKLLVADIGTWGYPVHHHNIIKAMQQLNPGQFSSRKATEEAFATSGLDFPTRQFLLKSLYRKEGVFSWRFNLEGLASGIDEVGSPLPMDARFQGPSLFLTGSKSAYVPKTRWHELKIQFPLAQVQEIQNAGHWLHADQPAAFYEASMAFFQAKDMG